jgi:hypothetical protein
VDKKVDERPFREAARDLPVSFVEPRHHVFYAGYSMVRATLELIRGALRDSAVRKLVLLSGDSYPIKPSDQIAEMLSDSRGILGHIQVGPESECDRHVFEVRYQDCSLLNERIAGQSRMRCYLARIAQNLLSTIVLKGESPMPLFRGSQWWSLPRDMVEYCLEVSDSPAGRMLERYLKLTDASDELFFQTLLLNSRYRDRCFRLGPHKRNAGVVYSDFSVHRESPALLDLRDLSALRRSPCPFARKFHEPRSIELRDAIDRELRIHAQTISPKATYG